MDGHNTVRHDEEQANLEACRTAIEGNLAEISSRLNAYAVDANVRSLEDCHFAAGNQVDRRLGIFGKLGEMLQPRKAEKSALPTLP